MATVNADTTGVDTREARRVALWQRRLNHEEAMALHEGHERQHKTAWLTFTAESITLALKLCGLWPLGRRNAHAVQLVTRDWPVAGLPAALDGFRILHLTDFHFPRFDPEFTDHVCAALAGVTTDLCVMTGDFKYGHYGRGDHVAPELAKVLAGVHAAHGIYAVLGNHDLAEQVAPMRALGVHVLLNEGQALEIGGQPVWIGGTDDPHRFRAHDVDAALSGAPPEAFRILLVHSPEAWKDAAAQGVHLYLCGHTHAGQVCLPGSGPIKLNARSPRRLADGHWREGPVHGFTSPGLGVTDLPVRYFCPPRAHLFTLRPASH